jgi:hypothetical protein
MNFHCPKWRDEINQAGCEYRQQYVPTQGFQNCSTCEMNISPSRELLIVVGIILLIGLAAIIVWG